MFIDFKMMTSKRHQKRLRIVPHAIYNIDGDDIDEKTLARGKMRIF